MASGGDGSPTHKTAQRPQRIMGLLYSLQEEIEALQMENRALRNRLALFEGRDLPAAGLMAPEAPEGPGKTKKSIPQIVQAAYQVR